MIVWNEHLRFAPIGYPYDEGSPTIVLFEDGDRLLQHGLTFSVPDVPPGMYAVVFYERDEEYQHYFWDEFTVVGEKSRGAIWVVAGLMFALAVAMAWLMVAGRRVSNEP